MIPTKIKSLFQFIDYLFENISYFNSFNSVNKEYFDLIEERSLINQNENINSKLKYKSLQKQIFDKGKVLDNLLISIYNKAIELDIVDHIDSMIKLKVISEIHTIKDSIEHEQEIMLINSYLDKYLAFRQETCSLKLDNFLISELDCLCLELFAFFITDSMDNRITKLKELSNIIFNTRLILENQKDFNSHVINSANSEMDCVNNNIDLKALALLYVYNGESINENNKDSVAVKYGFQNGNKLKQHYNFYSNVVDRTANEDTKLKLKNKINLFKKVELILNEERRNRIRDEITILESFYHNW